MAQHMSDTKINDLKREKIVTQFLQKYFFSRVYEHFETVEDRQRQLQGIDVIADGHLIDIKSQSSDKYINNPTSSFILELSFLRQEGDECIGWFLNNELLTEQYAFVWIHKAQLNCGQLKSSEDIYKAEIMLVDKQPLKYTINCWRSDTELFNKAHEMRLSATRRCDCSLDGVHISHTHHLDERPTNIVAQKTFLKKFSVGHYIVTKDYIKNVA